ncbi:hypothetical protein BKA70DRAFT_1250764 [Coprinopsis sp. MPI-PUGE-AT-0042]|nr:hypothetical protein BKA70DRAFT_1250764 [Coprinopsis sp. MPI-PUGE-AT-0042]
MLSSASRRTHVCLRTLCRSAEKAAVAQSSGLRRQRYSTAPAEKGNFNWSTSRRAGPPQNTLWAWPKDDRDRGELEAILKAQSGHSEELAKCLWTYIAEKNPQQAIDVYNRYTTGLPVAGGLSPPEPQEDPNDPLAIDVEVDETLSASKANHEALYGVIAAHGLQGSLEAAIEVFVSAKVRWSDSMLSRLLRINFDHDPALRRKMELFFADVKIAHGIANPAALSVHIKALSSTKSIKPVLEQYETILRGITRKEPFIAPTDTVASTLPVSMSERLWGSFLAGFFRCDRSDLASRLWKNLGELGVPRTTGLWTTLFDGFDHLRLSRPALAFWKTMVAERVKPDALTYRAIISVCLRDKQTALGMHKFTEFKKVAKDQGWGEVHMRFVYNTVLDGLLFNQQPGQAMDLLEKMKTEGPSPDVVTYNTLLSSYHRRGDFAGIARVISDMDREKVQGDMYTFSTLLTALFKAGRGDAVDIVFNCMKEQNLKANIAIYTALIDHQLQSRTEENLRAVLTLLDKMEKEGSVRPNDVTYTSILTNLHRGNWLTPEKIKAYREAILRRMKTQNVKLNLPGYHAILRACWDGQQEDAVKSVMAYYEEIKQRGIPLVQTTWYIILAGLAEHDEWRLARQVIEEMRLSNSEPSASLSRLVAKIMGRT